MAVNREIVSLDTNSPQDLTLKFSTPAIELKQEQYEKKRTAVNAGRKRAGAGGRYVTYGYDLLSKKERKKYMKGSAVVSYNLNEVITLNAFNMLDQKKQSELVEHWLNNEIISKNKLMKFWGLTEWNFKKIYDKLNVTITNPKLLATIARVTSARENMTPERWNQVVEKRKASKAEKLRKEAEKLMRQQEKEQRAEAAAAATITEEAPPVVEERRIQQQPIVQQPIQQPVYQQPIPQVQTYQTTANYPTYTGGNTFPPNYNIYTTPAPTPVPSTSMNFNVANQSGVLCLDSINKMLAFLHYSDSRKLYKISVTVEEVR